MTAKNHINNNNKH